MKEDSIADILMSCSVVFFIVWFFAMWIVIYQTINKNCYVETYIEYPCEGATHYARIHRNENKACERVRIICKEVK